MIELKLEFNTVLIYVFDNWVLNVDQVFVYEIISFSTLRNVHFIENKVIKVYDVIFIPWLVILGLVDVVLVINVVNACIVIFKKLSYSI